MENGNRRVRASARLQAIDDEIARILRHFPTLRRRRQDSDQLAADQQRESGKAAAERPPRMLRAGERRRMGGH